MVRIILGKIFAVLIVAIGLNIPAYAQVPVIEDISKNSFNVIRHLSRVNEPALSLKSAEKIKRAVMANDVLDDGEKQMLHYLINEQSFIIKVPTSTVDAAYSKPVSSEAKALFKSLANPQPADSKLAHPVPQISQSELRLATLEKAAESGNAQDQFNLAEFYTDSKNVELKYRSNDKAIYWLKKASAQGHAEAQYELAGEYGYGRHVDGTGLDRSYTKSFDLYKKAAAQGHANAMVQIGQAYDHGKGSVAKSPKQAVIWYNKAAKLGDHWGMYYLAVQYLEGNGVRKSEEKAIHWLKKSSALGNENAEDELWERWGID
ncbi:MAG: tetratricopeptide repeat protein [Alphaproteobacteria bacterium]